MLAAASLSAVAFRGGTELAVRGAQPSRPAVGMMADAAKNPFGIGKTLPPVPKGPFGDYRMPGEDTDGVVGDRSSGVQIAKFQAGEDYLFFQGPAPKTAIQEDLPSFFSVENFQEIEIVPAQIAVTATGLLSFAVVLGTLLGDEGLPLPALPSVSVSLPTPSKPAAKQTLDEADVAARAAAKAEKEAAKKAELEAKAAEKAEKLAAKEARAAEKAAAKALKEEVAAAKKGEAAEAKAAEAAAKAELVAEEKEAVEKKAQVAEAKAAEVEVREEKAAEEKEKIAEKLDMAVLKEKAAAAKAARK